MELEDKIKVFEKTIKEIENSTMLSNVWKKINNSIENREPQLTNYYESGNNTIHQRWVLFQEKLMG